MKNMLLIQLYSFLIIQDMAGIKRGICWGIILFISLRILAGSFSMLMKIRLN